MPLNYQNSVVYKICCKDPEITDIYVGSTTNFKRRMSQHKTNCKNEKNNYTVYRFIRDHGGFENWSVVKIRDVCCKDKYELVAEERKEFEKLGATLNSKYPQRSQKEYIEENKEQIKEKKKEYREKNKEQISEKGKEYREKNKEQISEKDKKYREKNKEKIEQKKREYYSKPEAIEHKREYQREYNQKNREKILEKNKEKIQCPCGSVVCRSSLPAHKRSQKHQNWEKTNLIRN